MVQAPNHLKKRAPLFVYFLGGMLLGIVLPIAATFSELVRRGMAINRDNFLEIYFNNVPFVLRYLAPVVIGTVAFVLFRSIRRRQEDRDKYADELKAYSRELEMQNKRLQSLNSTLDKLVYSASHEMKTPVINFQSLVTMLHGLDGKPVDGQLLKNIAERMEISIQQMHTTLDDLTDVTNTEKGDYSEMNPLDVQPTIAASIAQIQNKIDEMGGRIILDSQPTLQALIPKQSLIMCMDHLLENAIRFSQPDIAPNILVTCRSAQSGISIEVQDNGVGINLEKNREKLFQMFTRLSSNASGSGIGLYIVRRTMDLIGGDVEVESRPGQGTTFRLILPAVSSSQHHISNPTLT